MQEMKRDSDGESVLDVRGAWPFRHGLLSHATGSQSDLQSTRLPPDAPHPDCPVRIPNHLARMPKRSMLNFSELTM